MSDALKRRCLHLFIDYPDKELETEIVQLKFPQLKESLLNRMIESIHAIRNLDLKKKPSIAETLDWAHSLIALQTEDLTAEIVINTLNVILKYRSDVDIAIQKMDSIVGLSQN